MSTILQDILGPEGAIKPYVRYDRIHLPENAGPYLGLRSEESEITKVYVADTTMAIGGVAWDPSPGWRLKLEYSEAFTGPREQHGVLAQSAFAF